MTSGRSPLRATLAATSALVLAGSLGACSAFSDDSSSATSKDGKVAVAASFYPIAYLAEQIGGDAVTVTSVTPANVEPHDFELSPKDVTSLESNALVFYVSGFQPSLDDALAQVKGPKAVDLLDSVSLEHHEGVEDEHDHGSEGHADEHSHEASSDASAEASDHDHDHDAQAEAEAQASAAAEELESAAAEASHAAEEAEAHEGELDPHFWLDPVRMEQAAKAVEKALAQADPDKAATFEKNLTALTDKLTTLNSSFEKGLAQCQRTTFVTSHSAFGYLAERYHLTQASISGLDPEAEPSPAEIAAIKKVVADTGTTTIFTEELVSPTTAQAVAKETGATTEVLSPLESAPESGDYTSAMENNLKKLSTALGCQ